MERGMPMSKKIELRKCTVCHESFRWNTNTRCICNECKKQSGPGASRKMNDRELFITISHTKMLKAS